LTVPGGFEWLLFSLPGRRAARGSPAEFGGLSSPPGADSFRSCGKNRKKGTPKGRAFYKAALPFGIPSSVICGPCSPYLLPCAFPASGRAAQSHRDGNVAGTYLAVHLYHRAGFPGAKCGNFRFSQKHGAFFGRNIDVILEIISRQCRTVCARGCGGFGIII
jgi:hypothetical protein